MKCRLCGGETEGQGFCQDCEFELAILRAEKTTFGNFFARADDKIRGYTWRAEWLRQANKKGRTNRPIDFKGRD